MPDPVEKIGVSANPDCGIGVADRGFSDLILLLSFCFGMSESR